MGLTLGNRTGIPLAIALKTSYTTWTTVESGLAIYRKGMRGGMYVIDYSNDGGVTWELDLVQMMPDEENIIMAIDDGVEGYRHQVRGNDYCIDNELSPTGFAGDEGTDWECIYKIEK